jgi:hypothetical protein
MIGLIYEYLLDINSKLNFENSDDLLVGSWY